MPAWRKTVMVTAEDALKGRAESMPVAPKHVVLGAPMVPPFPGGLEVGGLRPGVFLGRRAQVLAGERRLLDGRRLRRRVHAEPDIRRGLLGPDRPHRSCAGGLRSEDRTVRAVAAGLLGEPRPDAGHAAGRGHGHPVPVGDLRAIRRAACGRSASEPRRLSGQLTAAGYGPITTEIAPAGAFFYAEDYHQQYLAKNPNGYCGIGGTGVACPVGVSA